MISAYGYTIELNKKENKIEIHFPSHMVVTTTYSTETVNKLNETDLSVILCFVKGLIESKEES